MLPVPVPLLEPRFLGNAVEIARYNERKREFDGQLRQCVQMFFHPIDKGPR